MHPPCAAGGRLQRVQFAFAPRCAAAKAWREVRRSPRPASARDTVEMEPWRAQRGEPAQIRDGVEIEARREHRAHRAPSRRAAASVSAGHAARAHRMIEESGRRSAQPDQVVAAVEIRDDHHVGGGERGERRADRRPATTPGCRSRAGAARQAPAAPASPTAQVIRAPRVRPALRHGRERARSAPHRAPRSRSADARPAPPRARAAAGGRADGEHVLEHRA